MISYLSQILSTKLIDVVDELSAKHNIGKLKIKKRMKCNLKFNIFHFDVIFKTI